MPLVACNLGRTGHPVRSLRARQLTLRRSLPSFFVTRAPNLLRNHPSWKLLYTRSNPSSDSCENAQADPPALLIHYSMLGRCIT